jgi:hypothetical protein
MLAKKIISGWLLAGALLAGAGCTRNLTEVPAAGETPTIGIAVEFPSMGEVRSDVGELPASDLENALHSLTVWVFRSDNHSLVASREIAPSDFPVSGGVRRYSLPVTRSFALEVPKVDVFVLANAASIGADLTENSDWETLNNAFFEDSSQAPYYGFGLSRPVKAVDPDLGLPMSACGKNLPVTGEDPILRVRTVRLRRAVSRLRFVFCKTRTEGEDEEEVSIQRIILGGWQIPLKEYVFTTSTSGVVQDDADWRNNYSDRSYIIPGPSSIAENETPENLIYVNQDPVTYERMIDDAVRENTLTDLGQTYFRESDRRLSGKIEYTVAGRERIREFNMASPGDFARNHTWTVFGYFLSGRNLQLALNVLPWDYNAYVMDFSEESVIVTSKFVVDDGTVDLIKTSKDHYDAHLLPGVAAKGRISVSTPVGGRLMIRPVGDAHAFQVIPDMAAIDPTVNSGRIDILIRRNPEVDEDMTGSYITLSFSVETSDGRIIDADSEAIDNVYRFVL